MPDLRIIKKYPNRRLYDTELSRYITLADVRDLVLRCVPFRVQDTATDADLTRSILLQIMLEEESGGKPLFSSTMLAQIVRFYGGTMQGFFARYLEDSLDVFAKQQEKMQETWGENPVEAMARTTQRNVQLWADLQKDFLRAAGFPLAGQDKAKEKDG